MVGFTNKEGEHKGSDDKVPLQFSTNTPEMRGIPRLSWGCSCVHVGVLAINPGKEDIALDRTQLSWCGYVTAKIERGKVEEVL